MARCLGSHSHTVHTLRPSVPGPGLATIVSHICCMAIARSVSVSIPSFGAASRTQYLSVARQYTGPGDRSSPGFNRARRWPSRVRRRNPGPLSPGRRAAGMITVRASSAAADPNRSGHRLWSTAMRDGHGDARRAVSLGPLTCIPQDGLLRVRPEPRGTHFSG